MIDWDRVTRRLVTELMWKPRDVFALTPYQLAAICDDEAGPEPMESEADFLAMMADRRRKLEREEAGWTA